jgi:hypothetical protein
MIAESTLAKDNPLSILLDEAAKEGISIQLSLAEMHDLSVNMETRLKQFRDTPVAKILIAALKIEQMRLARRAANMSVNVDMTNINDHIRVTLCKQKQTETILNYINNTHNEKNSLRTCSTIS